MITIDTRTLTAKIKLHCDVSDVVLPSCPSADRGVCERWSMVDSGQITKAVTERRPHHDAVRCRPILGLCTSQIRTALTDKTILIAGLYKSLLVKT
jgi:hypothetical protein